MWHYWLRLFKVIGTFCAVGWKAESTALAADKQKFGERSGIVLYSSLLFDAQGAYKRLELSLGAITDPVSWDCP